MNILTAGLQFVGPLILTLPGRYHRELRDLPLVPTLPLPPQQEPGERRAMSQLIDARVLGPTHSICSTHTYSSPLAQTG
jgi:hypothetical protein